MNGNVLERKDHTSVFCHKRLHHRHVSSGKKKIAKIFFSFVLMILGLWLMMIPI